jgi:hypothetical protein
MQRVQDAARVSLDGLDPDEAVAHWWGLAMFEQGRGLSWTRWEEFRGFPCAVCVCPGDGSGSFRTGKSGASRRIRPGGCGTRRPSHRSATGAGNEKSTAARWRRRSGGRALRAWRGGWRLPERRHYRRTGTGGDFPCGRRNTGEGHGRREVPPFLRER